MPSTAYMPASYLQRRTTATAVLLMIALPFLAVNDCNAVSHSDSGSKDVGETTVSDNAEDDVEPAANPTLAPEDPCSTIACPLWCETECGWSRPLNKCVTGGETTPSEYGLGDCSGSTSITPTTATATTTTTTIDPLILLALAAKDRKGGEAGFIVILILAIPNVLGIALYYCLYGSWPPCFGYCGCDGKRDHEDSEDNAIDVGMFNAEYGGGGGLPASEGTEKTKKNKKAAGKEKVSGGRGVQHHKANPMFNEDDGTAIDEFDRVTSGTPPPGYEEDDGGASASLSAAQSSARASMDEMDRMMAEMGMPVGGRAAASDDASESDAEEPVEEDANRPFIRSWSIRDSAVTSSAAAQAVAKAEAAASAKAAADDGVGDFRLGDRVLVAGFSGTGTVSFVGVHATMPILGRRVGVSMDDACGKHDGTDEGHAYFACEPNHGLLVSELTLSVDPVAAAAAKAAAEAAAKEAELAAAEKLKSVKIERAETDDAWGGFSWGAPAAAPVAAAAGGDDQFDGFGDDDGGAGGIGEQQQEDAAAAEEEEVVAEEEEPHPDAGNSSDEELAMPQRKWSITGTSEPEPEPEQPAAAAPAEEFGGFGDAAALNDPRSAPEGGLML